MNEGSFHFTTMNPLPYVPNTPKPKWPFAIVAGSILGGLGLLQQQKANQDAKNAMNEGMDLERERFNLQKGFADRLQELNRILMEKVQASVGRGDFDPEQAALRYEKDTVRRQKSDMENLGAGLSNAGYQGNDSEVRYRLDRAVRANQNELQTGMEKARRGSLMDMIAAYNATNPATLQGAGSLVGQSNLPGMLVQKGQQGGGSFLNLMQGILPFLQGKLGGGSSAQDLLHAPGGNPFGLMA